MRYLKERDPVVKKFFAAILFGFTLTLYSGDGDWQPGPSPEWHTRWETAAEAAEKENKPIYVLHTGSDWCGFCKMLEKEVFRSKYFEKLQKEHLILLYLDEPSKKHPMSEEQRQYNRKTARQLSFRGGYPSAKLVNSKGEEISRQSGYRPLARYMTWLYDSLKINERPEFPALAESVFKDRKGNSRKIRVELLAWGEAPDKVTNPVSAATKFTIGAGRKIYFKIRFKFPKQIKSSLLFINDGSFNRLRSKNKVINKSGTYLFAATAPYFNTIWNYFFVHVTVDGFSRRLEIPCWAEVSLDILTAEEKEVITAKENQIAEDFRNAEFKIVGWKLASSAKKVPMKEFSPEEQIRLKANEGIILKIHYQFPQKRRVHIAPRCENMYGYLGSMVTEKSGDFTVVVSCRKPGKRDKITLTLTPERIRSLPHKFELPCNIIWE